MPFFLLLVTGLAYFLNQSTAVSTTEVAAFADRLLPPHPASAGQGIQNLLGSIIRVRGQIGVYSLVGFIWFSTRLFGSLRSVLAEVFDIETERGIIAGKLFDANITLVSTILVAAYTALTAYLAIATTRGVQLLAKVGLRKTAMGGVEYGIGQVVAFLFLLLMFFALYKYLPARRVRSKSAFVASFFTTAAFEIAKYVFVYYVRHFNPGSWYSGTVAAIILVVFWVYYAALIFILGGEVGQVFELRRVRRQQRETWE